MATWLALDLSIKSTGWALWSTGDDRPAYGTWELATDVGWRGRAYVRLHRNLIDLHKVTPIDYLVFEEPLPAAVLKGHTTADTLAAMAGLAAHAESFAEAIGANHLAVSMSAWRRHFIGSMPRGTKSFDLKALAMARCRELGFSPDKHDAAEAIGLLDHQLSVNRITPPWRAEFRLEAPLEADADRRKVA